MGDGGAPGGWYEPAYGPLWPLGWFCMHGGCPQLATLGVWGVSGSTRAVFVGTPYTYKTNLVAIWAGVVPT